MSRSHLNALKRSIPFIAAVAVGTFVLGLVLNAYYQAAAYNDKLRQNATIGAFIKTDGMVPDEVIKERLVNLDGVAEVLFVPGEQVLERALKANPAIKEIMVPGENPFLPYFVLRPSKIAAGFVQTLAEQVRSVEGIEEVRYDANLISVSEQLARFRFLYRIAFEVAVGAALFIILFRLISRWSAGKLDPARYLLLAAAGLAGSLGGAALYYLFSTYAVPSALIQMPGRYLAVLLAAGLVLTFVWEND